MSLDTLQAEANLQKNIIESVKTKKFLSKEGLDLKNKLLENLAAETDASTKVRDIQSTINKLLKEQEKKGKKINQHYIDQLKNVVKVSKKELEINKAKQSFKKTLMETVGLSNEYVKAFKVGGAAALGFMAMEAAVKAISSTVGKVVGLGKDLYINFGLSAEEATDIALQTAAASFSIEGLLYGTEALAEAAKSSVEYFGTISNLTMDSQKNIATLNKLGVDASKSVQLDKIFKDAAGDGSDLTDSIKVIAKKEGVTAKKLFEGMADDMSRLVGATEDEIKAMAKTNAQLIKRGLNMKQLEDISNNVLSVEQSMRAEAKARAFIGRDINANGVRQAALALQTATTEEGRNAAMLDMSRILEQQVGSAEDFNNMSIMQRKLFAEAYGMSVDGITQMLTKQEKFNELQAKGMSDEEVLAEIERQEAMDASITALKEMGSEAGNLSMAMLPALVSFKNLGGENTMIWKGFSKATKGAGNLLKKLYEMTAGKLLGKLGGIGETLGGGMVKSKSGKLFSKDSPQGKMITNLSGKKPKEMIPDTKDMSKTVADGGKASGKGGMKDKLKDMAEGLKAMGDGKVFAGIGAVALAGPAFIVALPSIPFLLFMGKVKLKQLEGNFSGLAAGLNSMSTTFMGSLAMGAFGIAAIPSILSIPFLLFMGKVSLKNLATNFIQLGVGLQIMSSTFMGSLALAAFGVAALIAIPSLIFLAGIALLGAVGAAGLIALGGGLAALGGVAMSGLPFLAIALIGALGIAMIPFAYALSLVTPLVEAFGNIIVGVFGTIPPIITAVANGFATMFSSVSMENIGPLLLLGPALMGIAVGLAAVGFMGVGGMLVLAGLAAAAPALIQMATALNGFFGGDGEETNTETESKESNTMGELLSEIKGLRQDLQAQPIMVSVDGKVVSRISRVQNRQSVSKNGYGG